MEKIDEENLNHHPLNQGLHPSSLNFQKLLSDTDDYLTSLPFITTEDSRLQDNTMSPPIMSPSGKEMILVQHFEAINPTNNNFSSNNVDTVEQQQQQ